MNSSAWASLQAPDHLLVGGVLLAPAQVLLDGAGEQHVLLEHHGHLLPQGLHVVVPHVHAAHQHPALGGVVQPGDELHQGGLGGAGAAQDAHGLAGLDVQVDVFQALLAGVLGVAEADVLKDHRAVLDLLHRILPVLQIALLVEQLGNTLGGGAGHGDHHQHHGEHHQAHEDHHDIAEHAGELTGGHGAAHNEMGAQPGHSEDAGIDAQLHQGRVEGQDLFRLGEVLIDLLGDCAELFLLMLLPDEGLDHPDAQQVLLHHIVHPVIALEHPFEDGVGVGHDKQQAHRQKWE